MMESVSVIPMKGCVEGRMYRLVSRNLILGVFVAEKRGFIGIREKCGYEYLFIEYHRDIGPPLGTAAPLHSMGTVPKDIPLTINEKHEHGELWWKLGKKTGKWRPVISRPQLPTETQHGNRQGFVDVWAHSLDRLPDNEYPRIRTNEKLFRFLKEIEKQIPRRG